MAAEYTYLGFDERIYSSYLSQATDGTLETLRGEPGGDPLLILRAGGDEQLPEVPADGLWVLAESASAAETKPRKGARSATAESGEPAMAMQDNQT